MIGRLINAVFPRRKDRPSPVGSGEYVPRYPAGAEKPGWPVPQLALQGTMVGIGLIAQGFAAYRAFILVTPSYQAIMASVLIELGTVAETIALIRRNWYAAVGAAITIVVSVSYNYTQVQAANAALEVQLSQLQMFCLALGPLSTVVFAALAIGLEFVRHEEAVATWTADQAYWAAKRTEQRKVDETTQAAATRAEEDRMYQRLLEEKMALLKLEAELQRQAELQHEQQETERQVALAKETTRVRMAEIRAERPTHDGHMSVTRTDDGQGDGHIPTFDAGFDGFMQYVGWMTGEGQTFDGSPKAKAAAAQRLGRSPRQIDRYVDRLTTAGVNGNGNGNGNGRHQEGL